MEAKKLDKISIEDYLNIERTSQEKYEYHNGTIYAMAGGTLNHGLICGNIFGEIRSGLKEKKSACKAITSEVKLYIPSKNSFLYPDTMVICGEIEKSAVEINAVLNPTIVIEVLSKTTSSYDRGDKFYLYRQIESLKEYILVEQDKPLVEIYKRQGDLWQITRIKGMENQLYLPSIDLTIKLQDIYQDVEL